MKKESRVFNSIFYPLLIGLAIWSVVKSRKRTVEYKELVVAAYCMGWDSGFKGCCEVVTNSKDSSTVNEWLSLYEDYYSRDSTSISNKLFKK